MSANKKKCLGCNTLPEDNPFHTCNKKLEEKKPKSQIEIHKEIDEILKNEPPTEKDEIKSKLVDKFGGRYSPFGLPDLFPDDILIDEIVDFIHTNYIPREEMKEIKRWVEETKKEITDGSYLDVWRSRIYKGFAIIDANELLEKLKSLNK